MGCAFAANPLPLEGLKCVMNAKSVGLDEPRCADLGEIFPLGRSHPRDGFVNHSHKHNNRNHQHNKTKTTHRTVTTATTRQQQHHHNQPNLHNHRNLYTHTHTHKLFVVDLPQLPGIDPNTVADTPTEAQTRRTRIRNIRSHMSVGRGGRQNRNRQVRKGAKQDQGARPLSGKLRKVTRGLPYFFPKDFVFRDL